MKQLYLLVLLSTLCFCLHAQHDESQEVSPLLLPASQEEANHEAACELLSRRFEERLELNTATRQELRMLGVLSDSQIDSFFVYLGRFGPLVSEFELQAVPGFDAATLEALLPLVQVTGLRAGGPLWRRILGEKNAFLLLRSERQAQNEDYPGSPNKCYIRYRNSRSKDFSLGFTLKKDAGERITWQPRQHGFDFGSAHLTLYEQKKFKTIHLGDYQLMAGQGLLLGGGFGLGKGADNISSLCKAGSGIVPYTASMESNFFRGAALAYQLLPGVKATGFFSQQQLDASIDPQQQVVTAIRHSGLHRTAGELAAKDRLRERVWGAQLHYQGPGQRLELGLQLISTHYNYRLQPEEALYRRFAFRGRHNQVLGMYYSYLWQNFRFFGEIGRSGSGGTGLVSGFLLNLSEKIEMTMLYRRYDAHFHSFYGTAFSEGSYNNNERGTYWGIRYSHERRWTAAAYFDLFRFPWLRYQVDAPSSGYDYLGRISWQPAKHIRLYAQFREEHKEKKPAENVQHSRLLVAVVRQNMQLCAEYKLEHRCLLRSRVQWSRYREQGRAASGGFALIQDVQLFLGRLRLSTRFAVFGTDDYENRQYAFEKDVLYAFSIPAYQGRGFRSSYLLQWNISRRYTCWLRYSSTRYQGDTKDNPEFKMQLKIGL